MYLPYDLGAFFLTKTWGSARGMQGLRRRPRILPLEARYQSLTDAELTEQQRSFFSEFDRKLQPLGFRAFCTITATNLPGKTLSRNYVHPSDTANCAVGLVEVETAIGGTRHFGQANSVQFITEFSDGRRLLTNNSGGMKLFDLPPTWTVQRCANVSDIATLKRRHDNRAAGMGPPLPAIATEPAYLDRARAQYRVNIDHQRQSGMYALNPGGATLRATDRLHWRAIRRSNNPFALAFRVESFLPAAALGIGLPLLASHVAMPASTAIAPNITFLAGSPSLLSSLVASVGVLVGGAAAGWFLKRQTILWTFLFIYVSLYMFGSVQPVPLSVFTAAVLAYYVRQFRVRRRLMLIENTNPNISPE